MSATSSSAVSFVTSSPKGVSQVRSQFSCLVFVQQMTEAGFNGVRFIRSRRVQLMTRFDLKLLSTHHITAKDNTHVCVLSTQYCMH